jgi:uncharacterized BrkB/YihY/UPF0761 family membrane protein
LFCSKKTGQEFLEDKAPQLGAALAYHTVFSLAPLILVLLAVVGTIFRDDPAGGWNKITQQMSYFLDASAVQVVQNIAQKASQPGKTAVIPIWLIALAIAKSRLPRFLIYVANRRNCRRSGN